MKKLTILWWTVAAFVANLFPYLLKVVREQHIEYSNTRLEKKRRRWEAHRIDGGGVVSLGKINQYKAIDKVAQFGSVRFVDTEVAVIMYSDKN